MDLNNFLSFFIFAGVSAALQAMLFKGFYSLFKNFK